MDGICFPELRYTLSNGISFCVACHKEFHFMFGKGSNNRFQLEIFQNGGLEVCTMKI